MAAYAALVSLMHIVDRIQHHPFAPISLHKEQIESLIKNLAFLQDFLEGYSHGGSKEADDLESRITDAAYAAEDIIESHIVHQILARSTSHGEKISSLDLYQGLQKVIKGMDFIKKEAMEIKEKMGIQDQLHRKSSISDGSSKSPSTGQNSTMVGFDDVLYKMMDKLTGGQSDRQIIPIVGMGGIGKTTLARNIYENQVVRQHFDILAWVTISQEYSMRDILLELLLCQKKSRESLSQMSEDELGGILYRSLFGRRYLIIMDDIWNIDVWDQLKFFFPDESSGSRIMLTTRLSNLACQVAGSHGIEMDFLNEDDSWDLFCKNVFGKEDYCPLEIKEIGKKIAKNCKGLPLSISLIGGLLAKSAQTRRYWEYIAENLNSIVSLDDNERCLKILYTSYIQLPVHLKPCFLYMGVYREDSQIRVSKLIEEWVAEDFLKPTGGKSMEEIAEEYLQELIDRNLVLVHKRGSNGNIKFCKIHDLLRDLCLREARKQKFLCVKRGWRPDMPQDMKTIRRICIRENKLEREYFTEIGYAWVSASLIHRLSLYFQETSPFSFRLLVVSSMVDSNGRAVQATKTLEAIFQLVTLRYLAVSADLNPLSEIPSSISQLWNLQTLIVERTPQLVIAPSEIWKMPQLRHVKVTLLQLPDPPSGYTDDHIVLENLQTLSEICDFKCDEEVVKRIPNIKKLKISYSKFRQVSPNHCLNNLGHLHKLESLCCSYDREIIPSLLVQNLTFPHSLKKLTLCYTHLHWEDMTTKIGSLPLLEVLKLKSVSSEPHWETVEGQFCSLKFLLLEFCGDLECWTTDNTHFPRLEHLHLHFLLKLKEIPSSIGHIPTLQSIWLKGCIKSAVDSAERIEGEQEELGNVGLQVFYWI